MRNDITTALDGEEVERTPVEENPTPLTAHDIDMLIRETGGNYDQYVRAGYQFPIPGSSADVPAQWRPLTGGSATDEGRA